jgi:hypothetical protein
VRTFPSPMHSFVPLAKPQNRVVYGKEAAGRGRWAQLRRSLSSELKYNPRFLIMSSQGFYRPGESVPETGVYSAIHDAHRPVHEVVLRKDDIFPMCVKCGEEVRFKLVVESRFGSSSSSA